MFTVTGCAVCALGEGSLTGNEPFDIDVCSSTSTIHPFMYKPESSKRDSMEYLEQVKI